MFKHMSENGTSYSLAISVNDENEEFFSKLENTIAELACEWKTKFPRLRSLTLSDLKLVKTNADGKYRNLYARIYTNKSGKVNCNLSEHKKVKGVHKRQRISIDDLVDESFKGSFVLKGYRMLVRSSKTLTLSVQEIMVTDIDTRKSYFDEYEEVASDESSSED